MLSLISVSRAWIINEINIRKYEKITKRMITICVFWWLLVFLLLFFISIDLNCQSLQDLLPNNLYLLLQSSNKNQRTMSYYNQWGSRVQKSKKNLFEKSNVNPFNQKNWIGGDMSTHAAPLNQSLHHSNVEWIQKKEDLKTDIKPPTQQKTKVGKQSHVTQGVTTGNKSAVQLMQNLLRGVRGGEQVRAYYSKEAEESLSELLTNKFKLANYINKLQNDMVGLDSSVVKNYQVLVMLLQQVGNADVEIKQADHGMQIKFNRSLIQHQEAQIQRLQKQKEQREKQMKYIVEEYESIIFNFNDVIEKLIIKDDPRNRVKY